MNKRDDTWPIHSAFQQFLASELDLILMSFELDPMHRKWNGEAEGNSVGLIGLFMLVLSELVEMWNNPNYFGSWDDERLLEEELS